MVTDFAGRVTPRSAVARMMDRRALPSCHHARCRALDRPRGATSHQNVQRNTTPPGPAPTCGTARGAPVVGAPGDDPPTPQSAAPRPPAAAPAPIVIAPMAAI